MLRSLYTGISGMRSMQTMMDVTGNNIANVNTTGYKSANTVFEDTLSQTLANATPPNGTNGGTNPAQVGLGVRVASITTNFSQGATQSTGRNTDMLVNGDGFFVTKLNGINTYTRNGSFSLDASGTLTSSSGGIVQGWAASNGTVVTTGPTTGLAIPVGTLIPPKATSTLTAGGNLNALAPNGTTVSMPYKVYDTAGSPLDIKIDFTPKTRTGADPASPVNQWTASYTFNGGASQPLGDVNVDTTTGALTPASFSLAGLTGSNGVVITPAVKLDLSKMTGTGSGSPKADSTAKITDGDGYGAASLASWKVDKAGTITGVFSNSQTMVLGRIAVATFNNPAGLDKQGGSDYAATPNSGAPNIGAAGVDGRGTITTGALEMSNVDLAQEFTNLIVSQRGFQANSRVITTSDSMLEELVNLKR